MTAAKSSTTPMYASSPSAAAAMPASFGNGENAPAETLIPARASGSMWLRAFDLNSAGMPRRVASLISCTPLVNSAAWAAVIVGPDREGVVGQVAVESTGFRKMNRCMYWFSM